MNVPDEGYSRIRSHALNFIQNCIYIKLLMPKKRIVNIQKGYKCSQIKVPVFFFSNISYLINANLYSMVTFGTKENNRVRQASVYLRSIGSDCQFRSRHDSHITDTGRYFLGKKLRSLCNDAVFL